LGREYTSTPRNDVEKAQIHFDKIRYLSKEKSINKIPNRTRVNNSKSDVINFFIGVFLKYSKEKVQDEN
jgi:hypothetical protein